MKSFYIPNIIEVGIDEAGRGPLFGRVYVGACILSPDCTTNLIRDSKKLSARKRLIAYDYIKEHAIDYAVAWADEKQIDKYNILNATLDTMTRAIQNLNVRPDHILVDGTQFIPYVDSNNRNIPHTCIKDGDDEYMSIAAASILAKIDHDKYIENMCNKYPNLDELYGLRQNKGYGTKEHIAGIKKYGISEWHRTTFGPCKFGVCRLLND